MSQEQLALSCQCGKITGTVNNVIEKKCTHMVCYCDDCQIYAEHLPFKGQVTDEYGGTRILQTSPKNLEIHTGSEHIRSLRLSPKGLIRWYSECCSTPLVNNVDNIKLPFVGIPHTFWAGQHQIPLHGKAQAQFAIGNPPGAYQKVSFQLMKHSVAVLARAWWNKEQSPSPFYKNGQAISEPQIMNQERRNELKQSWIRRKETTAS